MNSAASRVLFMLAAFAGPLACDAADVPVFAGPALGSAGSAGNSGNGGSAAVGGVSVAGSSGSGGVAEGQGGDVSSGGGDTVCHGNADCPETFYCQTQSCEPGAPGVCAVKQPVCDTNLKPVCGCNHLTYWNDCLREQYGISAGVDGACSVGAQTCHMNNDCPRSLGASCAHLLPPGVGCGTSADQGTCWVTPDCPTNEARQWQSCPPPGSGNGLGPCTSTCDAVKAGHPFVKADSMTCP